MEDRLAALIAQGPGLERASRLVAARLPVPEALEELLPDRGLRPGSMVSLCGMGARSMALALLSKASHDSWTACVGLPELGMPAAAELGVDLDRLVVVGDPQRRWTDVLAALVDAFDIVLTRPPAGRDARRIAGRVRERDAVLLVLGPWQDSDVRIEGTRVAWHGIGAGHGHLAARTLEVTVTGRRAAARARRARLWLPAPEGGVRSAGAEPIPLRRTG